QGNLDVAGAEFHRIVEVAELALVPHLYRPPMAAFVLADPHAFGVVAISAEGGCAGRADPFRTALMPAFLVFKPLLERFHQLVEAAKRLHQLLFIFAQMLLCEPAKPFL